MKESSATETTQLDLSTKDLLDLGAQEGKTSLGYEACAELRRLRYDETGNLPDASQKTLS